MTCADSPSAGNRSQWVKSSAGFSAAVELQTAITESGSHRRCVTSWKLHVRGQDGNEQVITVGQRDDTPEDNEWLQENSFQIDGWSEDGTVVVASQIEAQGDWDETTPIVFDFRTKKAARVELLPLFKTMIPADCYVVYRVLGVGNNGAVLLSALSTDNDRDAGTPQCFPQSRWRVNSKKPHAHASSSRKKEVVPACGRHCSRVVAYSSLTKFRNTGKGENLSKFRIAGDTSGVLWLFVPSSEVLPRFIAGRGNLKKHQFRAQRQRQANFEPRPHELASAGYAVRSAAILKVEPIASSRIETGEHEAVRGLAASAPRKANTTPLRAAGSQYSMPSQCTPSGRDRDVIELGIADQRP